jgi:hypothetical protein
MFEQNHTKSTSFKFPHDIEEVGKSICEFSWDKSKNEDIENYCGLVYIFCLYREKLLSLPVDVVWDDRPDFSFSLPRFSVGLEVTKATTESLEHARDVANKEYPDGYNIALDMCRSNTTSKEITREAIRPLGELLPGSGLTDNSDEHFWVQCIVNSIHKKIHALNNCGFKKFTSNELIILDDTGAISRAAFNLIYAVSQVREIYHSQVKKCELKLLYDKIHVATRTYNESDDHRITQYCLLYDILGNCRTSIYNIDDQRFD